MVPAQFLTAAAFLFLACTMSVSCRDEHTRSAKHFDSQKAYEHILRQIGFGPRVPGTLAHGEGLEWLITVLRGYTPYVSLQTFNGLYGGVEVEMTNILASFYTGKKERILLCAHWDSRHQADRDPDPSDRSKPVPGANDGASGVAVLLEVARCFSQNEPQYGVDIVLFDGEDGGEYGNEDSWLLGSRHFAAVMPPTFMPKYALLLDMVGDSDLALTREINSMEASPKLWKKIEKLCSTQGIKFSPNSEAVLDDHIPLIERGITAINLIDFEYPFWHTLEDTPDKCSPESLGKIGGLVLSVIFGE